MREEDRVQVHFDNRLERFITEMHLDSGIIIRIDPVPSHLGPLIDIAAIRPGVNRNEDLPMLSVDEAMLLAHVLAAVAANAERKP